MEIVIMMVTSETMFGLVESTFQSLDQSHTHALKYMVNSMFVHLGLEKECPPAIVVLSTIQT